MRIFVGLIQDVPLLMCPRDVGWSFVSCLGSSERKCGPVDLGSGMAACVNRQRGENRQKPIRNKQLKRRHVFILIYIIYFDSNGISK